MEELKKNLKKLEKIKYPLLILVLGAVILLLPLNSSDKAEETGGDSALETVLAKTEGVGAVQAILSEKGAVIVCEGADNADTRLTVIKAVSTYTGFGSDKITVLKMRKT